MSKRDKFLTETMGECWHEQIPTGMLTFGGCYPKCEKCNTTAMTRKYTSFSSPAGFFKLWNWAKEQEWWERLIFDRIGYTSDELCDEENTIYTGYVSPDRFADAVYDFLKEREDGS